MLIAENEMIDNWPQLYSQWISDFYWLLFKREMGDKEPHEELTPKRP